MESPFLYVPLVVALTLMLVARVIDRRNPDSKSAQRSVDKLMVAALLIGFTTALAVVVSKVATGSAVLFVPMVLIACLGYVVVRLALAHLTETPATYAEEEADAEKRASRSTIAFALLLAGVGYAVGYYIGDLLALAIPNNHLGVLLGVISCAIVLSPLIPWAITIRHADRLRQAAENGSAASAEVVEHVMGLAFAEQVKVVVRSEWRARTSWLAMALPFIALVGVVGVVLVAQVLGAGSSVVQIVVAVVLGLVLAGVLAALLFALRPLTESAQMSLLLSSLTAEQRMVFDRRLEFGDEEADHRLSARLLDPYRSIRVVVADPFTGVLREDRVSAGTLFLAESMHVDREVEVDLGSVQERILGLEGRLAESNELLLDVFAGRRLSYFWLVAVDPVKGDYVDMPEGLLSEIAT